MRSPADRTMIVRRALGAGGLARVLQRFALAGAVLALLAAAACGPGARAVSDAGPDGSGGSPDGALPSGWKFVADDDGAASPAVVLSSGSVSNGQATLEVVARGVADLGGIAFRLSFDPSQAQVRGSDPGAVWGTSSTEIVTKFATRKEGELWAGLGHKGPYSFAATSATKIASVKIQLQGSRTVRVAFRALHNLVLDGKGQAVKVQWLGGRFEPVK